MAVDPWADKLDAYLDGELAPSDAVAMAGHLRICPDCTAAALQHAQLKLAVRTSGKRYEPDSQLRNKIAGIIREKTQSRSGWRHFGWQWRFAALAALIVLVAGAVTNSRLLSERAARRQVYSELADLHVATLASSTPVDVLSSDRHTVKPWFQGKIPFTFNLPELQGTEFTLLGGRVTYLRQTPGAQLIFRTRQHNISAFIFPEASGAAAGLPSETGSQLSFDVETWEQNGLRYFLIGDVNHNDIRALSKLLRDAG
jgi:anti-sigma factor RsiW